jgi:hypothetical protein
MYYAVKKVQPLSDYCLQLQFEDGQVKKFDCKPYLDIGRFKELKSIALFGTVKVSFDSIEWKNGLDLDPELLYERSTSNHV